MKLKLNLSGSAEPLINYLKSYLRIRDSLLLEIDTEKRAFVAKTFTDDRSAVRFASLMFDDAAITVVSDDGNKFEGVNSYDALGAPGATTTFTVVVEFVNGTPENDNQYQGAIANINFIVETVQQNGVDNNGNLITP